MVEPSPDVLQYLCNYQKRKDYKENFVFINKCIGNPNERETTFFDRPHMSASKYKTENTEVPEKVSVLLPKDIFDWQQPPLRHLKMRY